jgi:4-oxalocrotonate tautomerase
LAFYQREEELGKQISRRSFMKKSAIVLGAVAVCDLSGVVGNGQVSGPKTMTAKVIKEKEMPHVIVKLWPGRSELNKKQLADAIVKDVVAYAGCDESSVSVTIEEIKPGDWAEKVYKPDILNPRGKLYKKPGYSM